MLARMMETMVSSTVMMAPAAMYQNQSFITWVLMREPPLASPAEANVHECVDALARHGDDRDLEVVARRWGMRPPR